MEQKFRSNLQNHPSPKSSSLPATEAVIIDGIELLRSTLDGQLWVFGEKELALGISDDREKQQEQRERASTLLEFLLSSNCEVTRKNYQIELKNFLDFLSEFNLPIEEKRWEKLHLIAYRDHLKNLNYAFKSIRKKISVVNSYLTYLEDRGVIFKNRCTLKKRELPRDQLVRPTNALTDEEAFALLDLASTHHPNEQLRSFHSAILSLFLSTGMRKSELISLRGSDYCEVDGIFCLKILGKGGKIREVPLTERSKRALDDYLEMMKKHERKVESGDPLFQPQMSDDKNDSDLKRECSRVLIDRIIQRYCTLAGIKKRISPHSLRATTITHLREQGADIYAIAEMAGHASPETTKRYIKRADLLSKSAAFKSRF
ncbi:MAG: tyrosine-type recombinase/integrase [Oligoflexia bacterium]|nr:tyrosine-type recombinase/integrase [Oligoflexia bacterium]